MDEQESELPVTQMPTIKQDPSVAAHATANDVRDAHPVPQSIVDDIDERFTLDYALADIQAIAGAGLDLEDLGATHIETREGLAYYTATSDVFYRLAARAADEYNSRIEVDRIATVAEAHTRTYLRAMHDYDGDFDGREATLCNALNDPRPAEGAVTHETEPEDGHYGYVDARGLVVEPGTHTDTDADE